MEITLRNAEESDVPSILSLIRELAVYERAPAEVTITEEELIRDGFRVNPVFEVIMAESEGRVLGMAFFYIAYSTWKGKSLYLEDIIVREEFRGLKIGKKLFEAVILKAKEISARRMMWQVLEWNEPAISFYKKYNAVLDPEWVNGKFTQQQIEELSLQIDNHNM